MTICLDTSAYSQFQRGHAATVNLIQITRSISISAVVLGELHGGFRRGSHYMKNAQTLLGFMTSPRVNVLHVDATTADRYGQIQAYLLGIGTPLPTNDVWIAAHAMQHGLQVVTLDKHFLKMPQVSTLVFTP
jgi:tRNA(fMet)-specific endonuclease VapC